MPKDDYFAIIYKILQYLYDCKRIGSAPDLELFSYDSPAIGINEKYWRSIMLDLAEEGYIKGLALIPTIGNAMPGFKITNIEITMQGIQYLHENSMMNKAAGAVKSIFEIAGIIIPKF